MLPPLGTTGDKIIRTDTGEVVVLRGVNRSGLEYSSPEPPGSLARAGITIDELNGIAAWGPNVVRLPFNQQWALPTASYDAEPYLAALDFVIEQAAARGLYTLLDLQWLNAIQHRGTLGNGRPNFVPPLPDAGSIKLWTHLGRRYQQSPSVLFDLFNEPHDSLPDDPVPLEAISTEGELSSFRHRRVSSREWKPWATHLVHAVRRQHPAALVFVSGVDWGYDLEGFPLPNMKNIVYSSHVYPNKRKPWDKAFGRLAGRAPVFIGELGGQDADVAWGRKLLDYLEERQLGWAAWSWSDHPHLIRPDSTRFEPTLFGSLIRESLSQTRQA